METITISTVALIASILTLFSGFGLGTLLMPAIAIFFPIEVAIATTAMVHFANNLFKLGLLGQNAKKSVLLAFGVPAIIFAIVGALTLTWLSNASHVIDYIAFGKTMHVSPIKLIIGILILSFVILESIPKFSTIAVEQKFLAIGGMLSGFFGGLSGHQGVFRSMFLIKAGLSKEQFVATGVILAVMVDTSRLLIYGLDIPKLDVDWTLVCVASVSAFIGSYLGAKLLKKITISIVQTVVSILLTIVAIGMMTGVL
ncbi:MAG: sulfite exporter TauE/SafE family protein [Methylophilus sp.]|jgi:hypothetical protein